MLFPNGKHSIGEAAIEESSEMLKSIIERITYSKTKRLTWRKNEEDDMEIHNELKIQNDLGTLDTSGGFFVGEMTYNIYGHIEQDTDYIGHDSDRR